jgi:hypothetical protein
MNLTRSEILDELDPDWRDRYAGDVELAWGFYSTFAKDDIERVKRENAA